MNRSLVIRAAQPDDIDALSEIAIKTYSDAFGHTFTDADLASHIEKNLSSDCFARIINDDVVLLAEVGGCIVGYVQFGAADKSSLSNLDQELRRIYIDSEFQNAGYGSALMDAALGYPCMTEAASIFLDVWEHNHRAQRFYSRYRFEVIGTRLFTVESGAETSLDLIMVRKRISP